MKLIDYIITLGETAIRDPNKYFIPGHNGLYNDPETPVRNKGHWLITFVKVYEITHDKKYLDVIKDLADYLISDKARPYGFSFHHRSKEGKDRCNGLIGQAWTFEALAYASSVTENLEYAELVEDVFFQHTFNYKCGLWNRLEIDGTILSIDPTFNHQLWFAACAAMLETPRRKEIRKRILIFLDFLHDNLTILDNGLIYHPIENLLQGNESRKSIIPILKNVAKTFLSSLGIIGKKNNNVTRQYKEKMIYKSIGYHQFNMYAFAMLKEKVPNHPFWESPEFGRSVNYLVSKEFKNELIDNRYGYPYNPPGFEVPYALSVFTEISDKESMEILSWWINEQLKRCYNTETQMMDKDTEDSLTHTARIYELMRLPSLILKRIEVAI